MTQLFYHHVGAEGGGKDFPRSLARRVRAEEVRPYLQRDLGAQEGKQFAAELGSKFREGFNCWGIPIGAGRQFDALREGDVVLLIGKVQTAPFPDGYFQYAGKVQVKYPEPLHWTSEYVWEEPRWPYMFFFDAVDISLPWSTFLRDVGYSGHFYPQGWFYRVSAQRCRSLPGGDPAAYLQHIVQHYP